MTATIISLDAVREKGRVSAVRTPRTREDFSVTYGLLLRISLKLGIPLEPDQHAWLHRYGHLLP